jgi:4,5-DOPA dioxygenase extradiol
MPLLGKQPDLVHHMQTVRQQYFAGLQKPTAIVVFSAHWESSPVKISSAATPEMLYDYSGFPSETYQYKYPAPGDPQLAARIHELLQQQDITSELDDKRDFDHGVFVPLMIMFPEADIPVVSVSLHPSLNVDTHLAIGKALAPLRDQGILILGSGYSFHNLPAFFHPTDATRKASRDFNDWLKHTMLESTTAEIRLDQLQSWEQAPGARTCHPREEHLLPLFMVAATGGKPELIFEVHASDPLDQMGGHAASGFLFQ